MKRIVFVCLVCCAVFTGCSEEQLQGEKLVVEEVQGYKPNLPAVPTIPAPSVPEMHADGTYSVYGLRKNIRNAIDTKASVTAYIVRIYEKPECPKGKPCHTLMPHLFLADEKEEQLDKRLLKLVGYAESFEDMENEKKAARRGRATSRIDDTETTPIVWDWRLGNRYKITGEFTRQSGSGFMETDGLIVYESHACLDCDAK